MGKENAFYKTVIRIALPVTLQTLLQSSFSVIDQLMIGKLGSSSIAAVGLGGKFASIYTVLLGAITMTAGIMISQYMGQKDEREISRSFFANTLLAMGLAAVFLLLSVSFSQQILWLYTKDEATLEIASEYLKIIAFSFLPIAICNMISTLLRCMEAAVFPLYASITGAVLNTGMNYLLIFGKAGFPKMGVRGAAIASVISQLATCIVITAFFVVYYRRQSIKLRFVWRFGGKRRIQFLKILCPIVICEFLWSLGENVYTAIYGNIGTKACAAMTLTIPVQILVINALSGLSQAAGILIGKSLGALEYDRAYHEAKKLMVYGLYGSLILSLLLIFTGRFYVQIYQVEPEVRKMAVRVLVAFALISPVKVQNMILGGGIIRSGGKTSYIMWVDFIGTWIFGVPLGLIAAFVWKMQLPYVYFILSLEECVRFAISVYLFRKRIWMENIADL
ncbi:MAG: MATE family efflux transporter [Lachnospiraceae bacterium]